MGDLGLDVWRQILSKLDNASLQVLYTSGFEDQIRALSSDNSFWKERAEHIAGRDLFSDIPRVQTVDWKRVYYALINARSHLDLDNEHGIGPHYYGLDYLPSLLALIQVYGRPVWSGKEYSMKRIWSYPADPAAMRYLLSSGFLLPGIDERYALSGLNEAAYSDREWMINPILSVIDQSRRQTGIVRAVSHAILGGSLGTIKLLMSKVIAVDDNSSRLLFIDAATHGTREIAEWFLSRGVSDSLLDDMMNAALVADNSESFSAIAKEIGLSALDKRILSDRALERSSPGVLLVLERLYPAESAEAYRTLLSFALKISIQNREKSKLELIRYILTKISPVSEGNQLLKLAVQKGDVAVVKLLLSDERLDPNIGLYEMLSETGQIDIMDALVLDRRVKAEDMDERAVVQMFRVRGIGYSPERGDSHYALLWFLIIKRPTGLELVDWMIERRDRRFQDAARLTLEGRIAVVDSELAPIQALMLCLLYPTASYDEVMAVLKEEGMRGKILSRSDKLVRAYLRR